MGKIIVFLVLAFVVYAVIKAAGRRARRPEAGEMPAEPMVACERCKVNLPKSEAIEERGHFYCSEEHRRPDVG